MMTRKNIYSMKINSSPLVQRESEMRRITFNKPPYVGNEKEYIVKAVDNMHISGDGEFTKNVLLSLNK